MAMDYAMMLSTDNSDYTGSLNRRATNGDWKAVPPPMAPNYDHPFESVAPAIEGATITFTTLATVFVSLRIYWRIKSMGKLGCDDYIIIISAVTLPSPIRIG
jgi:hypothetical protein